LCDDNYECRVCYGIGIDIEYVVDCVIELIIDRDQEMPSREQLRERFRKVEFVEDDGIPECPICNGTGKVDFVTNVMIK